MDKSTEQTSADLAHLRQGLAWHASGHRVAIASVVSTWGSAPCPAGSQLLVRDDMHFEGSVSGGCVESAVIAEAVAMLGGGDEPAAPRLLTYGVSDEAAIEVGLACGGTVEIWLQGLAEGSTHALAPALLQDALDCLERRIPAVLSCDLHTGICELHKPSPGRPGQDHSLGARASACALADRSGRDGEHFMKVFNPRLRLVIVGAVHVAQHLAAIAQRCNYEVIVVDPREAFLRDRFRGVATCGDWPDDALKTLALDARSAVVTLTHDPKLDDPALQAALRSDAFYIGALGSRRTQAKRQARLVEGGHEPKQIARIHGPVGLDIGARNPAEIALAILAQITATLRGRTTPPSTP
ncbi:MAG: XdhC family protein [Pseudomonadota bacterium]